MQCLKFWGKFHVFDVLLTKILVNAPLRHICLSSFNRKSTIALSKIKGVSAQWFSNIKVNFDVHGEHNHPQLRVVSY